MDDFKNITRSEWFLYRELYKKSFYDFARDFWNEADPQPFVDGDLVQFYCETFQYACRWWVPYREINIKLPKKTDNNEIIDVRSGRLEYNINVPPRHSKSMVFNVLAGVWIWINKPIKLASVSHTQALATDMNKKRQKILNSERFHFFFPEIELETNTNSSLKNNESGELYSINRNAMTGYGADIIVNDDLSSAETARKDKEEMMNAWSYYQNTMPSRINNVNNYVILNIQQRLAPNDITGHILNDPALANEYTFIVLPALFEHDTFIVCPISGKIIKKKKGEYLWPERFGDYQAIRAQVGESVWQTQYLQKPVATDRTIIKDDMIIERDACECPSIDVSDIVYASHDFPVKDKDSSDYLGSVLGYRVDSTLYITDCLEKRMAFVKSVNYVQHLDEVFPGIIQVIEDKANGSPILQQLQDKVAGMQAYQPGTASKTQRLESASLYMTSRNVIFVRSEQNPITMQYELSSSMRNLKARLLSFPFVEHDDIVDAFDMLVLFVFMDRRYMVYGRSFDDRNIVDAEKEKCSYSTVFFNHEGDVWKMCEIGVCYGQQNKLVLLRENRFRGTIEQGAEALKEFGKGKKYCMDCSASNALEGKFINGVVVEHSKQTDFDKSVNDLSLMFDKKLFVIDKSCVLAKSDIESFKFTKSKDDTVKYATEKDGFCACFRAAIKNFGCV